MLKRVIVGLVGAAVLTGVGLSELNRLRGNECIKHDAVFRVQVLLLKHDVRTSLKPGTKWEDIRKFFAEHNIPFHSTKSDVSGVINTSGCPPKGCGSDAALITIHVQLDAEGNVENEPSVIGIYKNCM
jgi:hypothetical protein